MTEEEKLNRMNTCMECVHNRLNDIPLCILCEKSISTLTSEDEEICPEGKW